MNEPAADDVARYGADGEYERHQSDEPHARKRAPYVGLDEAPEYVVEREEEAPEHERRHCHGQQDEQSREEIPSQDAPHALSRRGSRDIGDGDGRLRRGSGCALSCVTARAAYLFRGG